MHPHFQSKAGPCCRRWRRAGATAATAAALAVALGACSPVFNWRETPVGEAGLVALLPCKPDRATRTMALGGNSVDVRMAGCNAGNATFAVAQVTAADRTQADGWLATWRAQARESWQGGAVEEGGATLPHADPAPAGWRFSARSRNAHIVVLWFSQAQANGSVALYQATVLGEPTEAGAASTFFEGLHLP